MTSPESEESESEEVTTSSEPSDLRKVTSTGLHKPPPEKQESSTSYTTPQTMSWSEPRPSLRTVLSQSMLPHSPNGTWTTTESIWSPERVRKERSRRRQDLPEPRPESLKDKKTESSTPRSLNNSANKDSWLVSAQDPANPAELMVIFWKEDNSISTLKRLNQEKNDLYHSYSFYLFDLSCENLFKFTGIVVLFVYFKVSTASSLGVFGLLLFLLEPYNFVFLLLWIINYHRFGFSYFFFFVLAIFRGIRGLFSCLCVGWTFLLCLGKVRFDNLFLFVILVIFFLNFLYLATFGLGLEVELGRVEIRIHTYRNNVQK